MNKKTKKHSTEKYIGTISLSKIKPAFIKLLLTSVALAGIVGIFSLLSGEFGETQGRILLTVVLTSGFSVGMLIYLAIMGTRYQLIGLAGSIVAAFSFVLGMWLVWANWNNFSDLEYLFKNYIFSTIAAIAIAHSSLIIRLLDHKVSAVRLGSAGTITCITFLTALFGYLIYAENFDSSESIVRLMGVLGILIVLGTIITPIWAKLQKK